VSKNSTFSLLPIRVSSTGDNADLRSSELAVRVRWFITMRWVAVLTCGVGTAVVSLDIFPLRLETVYFVIVTAFLVAANLLYRICARRLLNKQSNRGGVQVFLVMQMLGDFVALSLLAYALGSIETPILTLFMAHIILATLFFRRMRSLAIIASAWFFASLPLILEWAGVIPVISILDAQFKHTVNQSFVITSGFIVGIGCVYFVCWYLVSEISSSL